MKLKVYMRVARKGSRRYVRSSLKPSHDPIYASTGEAIPTVSFAIELDLPEMAFRQAEQVVATLNIQSPEIAAEVREIEPDGA